MKPLPPPRTAAALAALATPLALASSFAQSGEGHEVLFVRGADRSGGFLEASNDSQRTEHLCDIENSSTSGGNHGWAELRQALAGAGFSVTQIADTAETASGPSQGVHIGLELLDLARYAVVVMGSNNATSDQAAVDAMENYIRGGGGALFISDANWGSDWADASDADQQFLDRFGVVAHQDQGTYTLTGTGRDFLVPDHPVFAGVDRFDGEGVTPSHAADAPPGDVYLAVLARARNQTRVNEPPFGSRRQGRSRPVLPTDASLLAGETGGGRFAVHFDRNTFFNVNGAGTDINRFDNERYALNLFTWLAEAAPLDCTAFLDALPDGLDAPDTDADRDGLPNLVEYLLGLDPLDADAARAFTATATGSTARLSFRTRGAATDVTFSVEASATPGSGAPWSPDSVTLGPASRSADGFVTWSATTPVPAGSDAGLFLRLRVVKTTATAGPQ